MPRILTGLKITEVSAVDKGAGENVKIMLMKRDDGRQRSKPHLERYARRLRKFEEIFMSKELDNMETSSATGATYNRTRRLPDVIDDGDDGDETDVTKAHKHRGQHSLTSALIQHLHDRLDRRREAHGYTKAAKETSPMTSLEDIAKSHGVDGVVQIAKNIVEEQKSFRLTEEEFCKLIGIAAGVAHPELGARAFEKIYERNPVLAKAISVIKATLPEMMLDPNFRPQFVGGGDFQPQVISGGDWRDEEDRRQAWDQLAKIGRQMAPTATPERQFALAFEDPKNVVLANRVHVRPTPPPGGAYAWPR
jgi:hypothetical protein